MVHSRDPAGHETLAEHARRCAGGMDHVAPLTRPSAVAEGIAPFVRRHEVLYAAMKLGDVCHEIR
jgi:hypothetical protein